MKKYFYSRNSTIEELSDDENQVNNNFIIKSIIINGTLRWYCNATNTELPTRN
jgi:hypothetical protein